MYELFLPIGLFDNHLYGSLLYLVNTSNHVIHGYINACIAHTLPLDDDQGVAYFELLSLLLLVLLGQRVMIHMQPRVWP